MDAQEGLAKRVDSGALWRAAHSAENPRDEHSRRSADALVELARYVKTLPPDDRRFDALAELNFRQHEFPSTDDDVDALIARYGSNSHLQSHPDTFLRELVAIADRGARGRRRDRVASAKAAGASRGGPDIPGPSDRITPNSNSNVDPARPESDLHPVRGDA